ncbi:MAG: hypothetical protein JXR58_03425 [Bacteroidales bacterium]|nr:hypothetical protein [Bacteroidales bacterium]
MLEFSKQILEKVSFNRNLFSKELKKLIIWMDDNEEILKLKEWCKQEFGSRYPDVIRNTFENSAA